MLSRKLNWDTDPLIVQWHKYVYKVAWKVAFRRHNIVPFDELVGAGMLALVEAGRLFDPDKCIPFGIWIQRPIKWAMYREVERWAYTNYKQKPTFTAAEAVDLGRRTWRA